MSEETSGESRKRSRFDRDTEPTEPSTSSSELSAAEKARLLAEKFAAYSPSGGTAPSTTAPASSSSLPGGTAAVEIRKKVYIPESGDVNLMQLLIGPGGSTHRSIEEQSGAKIKFRGRGSTRDGKDEEDDDLYVLIISDREDQVKKAEEMVREILFEGGHAATLKRRQVTNLGNGPGATIDDPSVSTRDIVVQREIIGSIIGRGGENIRDMKDRSGATILVKDPNDASEPTRTIHIRGSKESVERAEELVQKLIREKENMHRDKMSRQSSFSSMGDNRPEYTIDVPDDKVGLVIGKGGMTIKSIQARNNVRIDVPNTTDPSNPMIRKISVFAASREDFDRANAEIQRAIAPPDSRGGTGGVSRGGGLLPGQRVEMYSVPSDKIGIVIGKGGTTIRSIQQRSMCGVQVLPAEPGNPMRNIQLTGTPEQCQRAREEIDGSISSYYQSKQMGGSYNSTGSGYGDGGYQQQYQSQYGGYSQPQRSPQQTTSYGQQWQQTQQYYPQAQPQQMQQTQQQVGGMATGGQQKYTREQWKAWKAYYDQFPEYKGNMPDSPPPELLLEDGSK